MISTDCHQHQSGPTAGATRQEESPQVPVTAATASIDGRDGQYESSRGGRILESCRQHTPEGK